MYISVDMHMCMNMVVSCLSIIMCIYCVCLYFMIMYSAMGIPLVSNCATDIRFIIAIVMFWKL